MAPDIFQPSGASEYLVVSRVSSRPVNVEVNNRVVLAGNAAGGTLFCFSFSFSTQFLIHFYFISIFCKNSNMILNKKRFLSGIHPRFSPKKKLFFPETSSV